LKGEAGLVDEGDVEDPYVFEDEGEDIEFLWDAPPFSVEDTDALEYPSVSVAK
jgi:hypothetical protein